MRIELVYIMVNTLSFSVGTTARWSCKFSPTGHYLV